MEAYKSYCPDCKTTYFWEGAKTGLGKTAEQLKEMRIKQTVCKDCRQPNLKTTLDHESEVGKEYDDIYKGIFSFVGEVLNEKAKKKDGSS